MSITQADRAVISRWYGPDVDESAVDDAMERYGSAYAVALELLQIRVARLIGMATSVAAGGRRSNHEKNIEATRDQIARLVGHVQGNSDLTLPSAAEDLFEEAEGDSSTATAPFSISTENARRAG